MNRLSPPIMLIVAALLLLGACTSDEVARHRERTYEPTESWERVQPWQRDELASDVMRPDFNPEEEQDWAHIYFSKEASHGALDAGGGGCGCN